MDVHNLQYQTVAQLREELFAPKDPTSFSEAVEEYMADVTETQVQQTKDMSDSLRYSNNVQNALTKVTEAEAKKVNDAYIEAAAEQPSEEPEWLTITQQVVMGLAAAMSGDIMMAVLMATNAAMQDTGLMKKLTTEAVGNNSMARFGFETGFAIGEAVICAGASGLSEDSAPDAEDDAAVEAAANKPTTAAKFRGQTLVYASQTMMQNNAWVDFLQGCGASQETAAIVGMLLGMAVAFGASYAAPDSALQDAMKGKMRSALAKCRVTDTESALHKATLLFRMTGNVLQIYSAGLQVQIGEQYEKLAELQRNVIAPATARLALYQGVTNAMTSVTSATEGAIKTIAADATAENQSFSALGNIFKQKE
jgi:hypothetical protein